MRFQVPLTPTRLIIVYYHWVSPNRLYITCATVCIPLKCDCYTFIVFALFWYFSHSDHVHNWCLLCYGRKCTFCPMMAFLEITSLLSNPTFVCSYI